MSLSPENQPHLLVLASVGAQNARRIAPSLTGLCRTTWLFLEGVDRNSVRPIEPLPQGIGRMCPVASDREALELALEIHAADPFDGLMLFTEYSLRLAAEIAEKTGIRFNSTATVERLLNKFLQRETLSAAGILGPRYHAVHSAEDLDEAARHVGFPAILKPVRGDGSWLVREVNSVAELSEVWSTVVAFAAEAPKSDRINLTAGTDQPFMILEQLVVGSRWHQDERYGDYVTVESSVYRGEIRHLVISDKFPLDTSFRQRGSLQPSVLPVQRQMELCETASAAISALNITEGMVNTELKLTSEGARIIEVNGRAGGGIQKLLVNGADYDIFSEYAYAALGIRPMALPQYKRHAAMLCPCLELESTHNPFRVTLQQGYQEQKGVESVIIPDPIPGRNHAMVSFVTGDNAESLHEHWQDLQKALIVKPA
ncbi:acetyl-CoA carboxylase biotin carboxylase subunit family protein [Streptomyces sp. NPDC058664]|uniref:ATP-grasp domain-containing protein n=1 Tax=unclassified Streptomyces TaxID=2593676 RepID=UPI0036573C6D